jgi:hypothetical protein
LNLKRFSTNRAFSLPPSIFKNNGGASFLKVTKNGVLEVV